VSPDFKWPGLDLFVRISNGKNKMAANFVFFNILASLDRFVIKNILFVTLFFIKWSRLAIGHELPVFGRSCYRMSGTGIRSNPTTDRGSVFGGLLYWTIKVFCLGTGHPITIHLNTGQNQLAYLRNGNHSKTGQNCPLFIGLKQDHS
jgi:hypothetical protein